MPEQGSALDEHWRQHIEQQRSSGLTKKAYCRKHKMKDHALGYWITKLALGQPKAGKGRFVAVEVNPVSPAQQVAGAVHVGVTRIVLPDGTRIESQEGDMSALATLAALIRGRMAP